LNKISNLVKIIRRLKVTNFHGDEKFLPIRYLKS